MRLVVMVEGQEDVSWAQWRALAATAERLGFDALLRSDHYLSVGGREERGALDAWGTICALAATTSTLRLGTLVSPATFRHPSVLAKLAVTADHVSGGRIELGLGTGWHAREHEAYGFPFPGQRERFDMLAEQVEVVAGTLAPGAFSFTGEHYAVRDLDALPLPVQAPLPLVLGGGAGPRAARLAARFAAEYNIVFRDPAFAVVARARLDAACEGEGRDPATLPLSLMTGFVIGADDADLRRRAERLSAWSGVEVDVDAPPPSWLVGTPERIAERLREYHRAGVRRVMLQHLLVDDDEALELVAGPMARALGSG